MCENLVHSVHFTIQAVFMKYSYQRNMIKLGLRNGYTKNSFFEVTTLYKLWNGIQSYINIYLDKMLIYYLCYRIS